MGFMAVMAAGAGDAAAHAAKAGTFTQLYTFSNGVVTGEFPLQLLVKHGKLYGITEIGSENGTLYSFDPATQGLTVLAYAGFGDAINSYPVSLSAFGDTLLIGSETGGIWSYDTATTTRRQIYRFYSTSGVAYAESATYAKGALYGIELLVDGQMSLYRIDLKTRRAATVFNFTGWNGGGNPAGELIYSNGLLYGAAGAYRNYNSGGIYTYNIATGAEKIIYVLNKETDGGRPLGITLCKGVFYGFTTDGAALGHGAAFSYDPATNTQKTLYAFKGGTDSGPGYWPPVCVGGTLYGTAATGGQYGYGTVFAVDIKTGQETVLHSFAGNDGANPGAGLVYFDNALYGTTTQGPDGMGGVTITGTIFKYTP
jgi:uncharacterized repeat protein (TIGR03803 family)